jgi:hypothetical protein
MSLSECFERIDPETWAKTLGINRVLFGPKEDIADPKTAGYAWLRNLLGVNSGRISFRSLLQESVQKGRFTGALEISEYCTEGEQPELRDKILEELKQNYKDTLKKIENLNNRILAVEDRIISTTGKEFLDDLKGKLQRIKRWDLPLVLSFEGLELYELYLKDVNELEETVMLLELEDQTSLKELFQIFHRLIENLKMVFLGEKYFPRELIEKYFLSLPALVLKGKREILWKIFQALDSDDIEALKAIEVPKDYFPVGRARYEKFELQPKRRLKQISPIVFGTVTRTLLDDVPKLEERFDSNQMVREFLEEQTRRAKTYQEAAKILLGGAKALLLMGDSDVLDLQARGLMELAEHHLSIR